MMHLRQLYLLGCYGVLSGCITETGNPEMVRLAARSYSSSPAQVSVGTSTDGIAVTAAWVALGDIRFVQSEVCDSTDEIEVDVEGPWVVDLISQNIGQIEVPLAQADYCRVRVPLDRLDQVPSGVPPELEDYSVLIRGTRSDDTPFQVLSRVNRELDVRSRMKPFSIDKATNALILAFDAAQWLDGVALETAEIDVDGTIYIDDNQNEDLSAVFDENVDQSMKLFSDDDDDGELDDDETEEALAESGL